MSDGSTSLVKAFGVRDMEMVHRLLRADLHNNFEYSEEKMHQLAVAYQDKDRGMYLRQDRLGLASQLISCFWSL